MPLNRKLKLSCTRFVSQHQPQTQQEWLAKLAASPLADLPIDLYGAGPVIAQLEQEVARLLDKEAALFLHKGVVAQQIALRVWSERSGCRAVALHPKSHIDFDERNAYERLHNLIGVRVGKDWAPFTVDELAALHEPLGAIVVELPLRQAGFKLPTWPELVRIAEWAHDHTIPLHFDGARLWESAPFYGRAHAEIAALADSVYVSFYKGLGGLAGCVLAGPAEFIAEAQVWQTRLGGKLYSAFPYAIAAYDGLQHHLPKMAGYCARAREVAAALVHELPVQIAPDPPHTNGFQLFLPGTPASLEQAASSIASRERIWLLDTLQETAIPNLTMTEVQIGEAAEQWSTAEIVAAFRELLAQAAVAERLAQVQ